MNTLSLAVLAFAVLDIKALDDRTTSANPVAFLIKWQCRKNVTRRRTHLLDTLRITI